MLSRGRNKRRRGKIYFFLGQEKNILFWEFASPLLQSCEKFQIEKEGCREIERCRRIAGAEEVAGAEEGHRRVKRCRMRMKG